MGRIVKGCVREVSLAQVSCILMYIYVAPPTPVGAWSMALGLRQRFIIYTSLRACGVNGEYGGASGDAEGIVSKSSSYTIICFHALKSNLLK